MSDDTSMFQRQEEDMPLKKESSNTMMQLDHNEAVPYFPILSLSSSSSSSSSSSLRKIRSRTMYKKPALDSSRVLEAGPHLVYHLAQPNIVYFLHDKRLEHQLREQHCRSMPTMWLDDKTLLMPLHHLQRIFGSTSSCVQYENFPPELVDIKRFKMASSGNGTSGRDYVSITRADMVRWYEFAVAANTTATATVAATVAATSTVSPQSPFVPITTTSSLPPPIKVPRLFTHGPYRELGCYEWLRKCCLVIECFERRGRAKAAHDPVQLAQRMRKSVPFLEPFSAAQVTTPRTSPTFATTTEEDDDENEDEYNECRE
jgi:hypothetical protein